MNTELKLYLDRDGKRAFLVPPEHELPPGDLTLLGLDGSERHFVAAGRRLRALRRAV